MTNMENNNTSITPSQEPSQEDDFKVHYEWYCKNIKAIVKEAKAYDIWRLKIKHHLLIKIGPKIAFIGKHGGNGYHYEIEKRFANLIINLSIGWSPNGSWCHTAKDNISNIILNEILYAGLLKDIKNSLRRINKYKNKK